MEHSLAAAQSFAAELTLDSEPSLSLAQLTASSHEHDGLHALHGEDQSADSAALHSLQLELTLDTWPPVSARSHASQRDHSTELPPPSIAQFSRLERSARAEPSAVAPSTSSASPVEDSRAQQLTAEPSFFVEPDDEPEVERDDVDELWFTAEPSALAEPTFLLLPADKAPASQSRSRAEEPPASTSAEQVVDAELTLAAEPSFTAEPVVAARPQPPAEATAPSPAAAQSRPIPPPPPTLAGRPRTGPQAAFRPSSEDPRAAAQGGVHSSSPAPALGRTARFDVSRTGQHAATAHSEAARDQRSDLESNQPRTRTGSRPAFVGWRAEPSTATPLPDTDEPSPTSAAEHDSSDVGSRAEPASTPAPRVSSTNLRARPDEQRASMPAPSGPALSGPALSGPASSTDARNPPPPRAPGVSPSLPRPATRPPPLPRTNTARFAQTRPPPPPGTLRTRSGAPTPSSSGARTEALRTLPPSGTARAMLPGDRWFVLAAGGLQLGPYKADELASRFQSGELAWTALVWRHGLRDWRPARRDELLVMGVAGTLGMGGKTARLDGLPDLMGRANSAAEWPVDEIADDTRVESWPLAMQLRSSSQPLTTSVQHALPPPPPHPAAQARVSLTPAPPRLPVGAKPAELTGGHPAQPAELTGGHPAQPAGPTGADAAQVTGAHAVLSGAWDLQFPGAPLRAREIPTGRFPRSSSYEAPPTRGRSAMWIALLAFGAGAVVSLVPGSIPSSLARSTARIVAMSGITLPELGSRKEQPRTVREPDIRGSQLGKSARGVPDSAGRLAAGLPSSPATNAAPRAELRTSGSSSLEIVTRSLPAPDEVRAELSRLSPTLRRCVRNPAAGLDLDLTLEGTTGLVRALAVRAPVLTPGPLECVKEALSDLHVPSFTSSELKYRQRLTW